MVFYVTFNNMSEILWRDQLYWWWNRSTRRKTTDLSQVTDKLYHIMSYRVHLVISRILYVDTGKFVSVTHEMTNMSSLKYIQLLHYKVNGRTFPISFRADFKWRQPVWCNLLHDPKKGCGSQCVRKPVVPYMIVLRNIFTFLEDLENSEVSFTNI